MAPQVRTHPGTRPTEKENQSVDIKQSSAPAHPSTEDKRLAKLQERYRHELMDDDERLELRERRLGIRRRLRSGLSR
jgi:hypothetical protein